MNLFHCSRMNANITAYACGMNQTAQFACVGCNQEDKAPRGTAKRVPVDRHEKYVPAVRLAEQKGCSGSKPCRPFLTNGERRNPPPPKEKLIPLWNRAHPCPGCGKVIIGHHWCRPCRRAAVSDDPEKAFKEVRRMRKAGEIKKGYPKGRLRRRAA